MGPPLDDPAHDPPASPNPQDALSFKTVS
jgi:hypothetical protein